MGILLPEADLEMLDRAQSKLFDEYWGKNMSELSNLTMTDFRQFAEEFRELLFDLPFQVPQDLIYLARTVNILSGMCTGLDPQFNVFAHLAPFAQKLISEEALNNRGVWVDELKTIAAGWLRMPIRLDTLLSKLERGEISMRTPELSQQVNRIDRSVRQITIAIIFTGLLLGGIQLLLAGQTIPGWVLLGVAALCIPGIIFTRLIKR
jgi:predicted unusual protein kinase regulating ubiquinone biosynthesis (AarF/ABC1/UbiB family)